MAPRLLMAEIKTPLTEMTDRNGDPEYVIEQKHTISDVLRHLVTEIGDDDWDHLIDLAKALKQDQARAAH